MELNNMTVNGNNNGASSEVQAGNGESQTHNNPAASEGDCLMKTGRNGSTSAPSAALNRNPSIELATKTSKWSNVEREMNEVMFWKVKLWMVIIFILLLIVTVIITSLAICAATHKDVDDTFDRTLFVVPRSFNGSFQMPNVVFKDELLSNSSDESKALATDLQQKLDVLYRSSPSLGRYFSQARVYGFRNRPVMADFQLTFLTPSDGQEELNNFTLSRELVYNVLRQFLYEQTDETGPNYINPASVKMVVGH